MYAILGFSVAVLQARRKGRFIAEVTRYGLICFQSKGRRRCTFLSRGRFQLPQLLIEVSVEFVAMHKSRVGLFELVAIQVDEDSLQVIDKFIDPREV